MEPFEAVNVGGGSVTIVPVGVYVGKSVAAPSALEMEAGGQVREEVTAAAMLPAPAPPV